MKAAERGSILLAIVSVGVGAASSQELFRDAMTDGAGWQNLNTTSTDSRVSYGYDYSADFIPEAPNSRPGDAATTGVKAESNLAERGFAGSGTNQNDAVVLTPTGQAFTGNYRLRFDAWVNFDTDAYYNLNRAGTSEVIGASVRTDLSEVVLAPDPTFSGFRANAYAYVRGDGDLYLWQFSDLEEDTQYTPYAEGVPGYYESFLPPVSPPVGQQIDYGPTAAGAPGFQWLTFEFQAVDDTVLVTIEKTNGDRLPIVRMDESAAPSTGESFVLLYDDDFYPSIAPRPEMQFGLFDNVVVEELIDGDFNADGFVSQADLDLVLLNWGVDTAQTIPVGWISTLGLTDLVSQNELDAVLLNWGDGNSPPSFAIPEPASVLCFLACGAFAIARRSNLRRTSRD